MLASLELAFVRNEDKQLIIPKVVFCDLPDFGGQYFSPERGAVELDDREVDRSTGILAISAAFPEEVEFTLAHEWRHHWQFLHGWEYDGIGWNNPQDYDASIYAYFTQSRSERDAENFALRKARNRGGYEELLDILPVVALP